MSLASILSGTVSFLKDAAPLIKTGMEIGAAAQQIYYSVKAQELAEQSAEAQRQELRRQKKLSQQQAQREARVKKASLLASGITSSTVSNSVTGISNTYKGTVRDLEERLAFNLESTNIQADAATSQAQQSLVEGVFSMTESAVDLPGEFTDFMERPNG